MKWTLVGSHGLDVVPKPLANERDFHAHEKLQNGSHGPKQSSTWQADRHTPSTHLLRCSFYHFGGSAKWL